MAGFAGSGAVLVLPRTAMVLSRLACALANAAKMPRPSLRRPCASALCPSGQAQQQISVWRRSPMLLTQWVGRTLYCKLSRATLYLPAHSQARYLIGNTTRSLAQQTRYKSFCFPLQHARRGCAPIPVLKPVRADAASCSSRSMARSCASCSTASASAACCCRFTSASSAASFFLCSRSCSSR